MFAHSKHAGLSLLTVVGLAMVASPLALGQTQAPGTPATGSGTGTTTPKADASKARSAPAPAPKNASGSSFLPQAGSNAKPTGSSVGASSNPFKPHSVDQMRQSNRLKVKGFDSGIMNDGEIVIELNTTIQMMAKVEDDYQGHRYKAIQEAQNAIKQIKTKAGKAGVKNATPVHESKAALTREESDTIIRQAHKSLEKVVLHISRGGNIKHMAAAKASVQKAIEELDSALESPMIVGFKLIPKTREESSGLRGPLEPAVPCRVAPGARRNYLMTTAPAPVVLEPA